MSMIVLTFVGQDKIFKPFQHKSNTEYRYEIIFTPVNWDDFSFKTIFEVEAIDYNDIKGSHIEKVHLGNVRIGYIGQSENTWTADHDLLKSDKLTRLSRYFFSLGIDSAYYESVNKFFGYDPDNINGYYSKVRDIAYSNRILRSVENELVFSNSFLRSTSYENIIYQYSSLVEEYRLSKKNNKFENEYFNILFDEGRKKTLEDTVKMGISIYLDESKLEFYLNSNDLFKNNIYALIGSNGSGKSKLLDRIVGDYLNGEMEVNDLKNIVLVSFSPFDKLTSYREYKRNKINNRKSVRFVGLRDENDLDGYVDLDFRFFESFGNCLISEDKRNKIQVIIDNLYSDPIFKNSDIIKLLNSILHKNFINNNYYINEEDIINYFNMLSSGHKVVIYTLFRLVDLVDLNTLVLFDEPELYLHPPLLSSFIRSISDLLIENNAMAIVTTHSPIVLQEIPKRYIKIIRNINGETLYEDVEINTLGERVDILTNEIFNLEIYESGYYKLILDFFEDNKDCIFNIYDGYKLFESHFNEELGTEAKKAIISLINNHLEVNERK